MIHKDLIHKVYVHGRDFNKTIFRKDDITLFLNEGIDRFIQIIPELSNIPYLDNEDDYVEYIPREYTHLLSTYSVARLYAQDERHYEATTAMNEFEQKLSEFQQKLENGEVSITNPETGDDIEVGLQTDYVYDNYFNRSNYEYKDEEEVVD